MKTKKITFNMIAAKMKEPEVCVMPVPGFEDMEMTVRKTLPLRDALLFVNDIVTMCIDEQEGYTPEAFDFALRVSALCRYAGFTMPKDQNKAYRVVYETGIFEKIYQYVEFNQYDALVEAARDKIQAQLDMMTSAATSRVSELIARMDDVLSSSAELSNVLNGVDFEEQAAKIYEGIAAREGKAVAGDTATITLVK